MAIGLTLSVGGTSRSNYVQAGTISINDNLWARNVMRLVLRDDMLNYRPQVGEEVILLDTDLTTRLFGGTIDEVEEIYVGGSQPFRYYQLVVVDFNQICDRFLVVDSFIDPLQTLSDIVEFVVDTYLAEDGIVATNVDTGPIIPETKLFNYRTVTQVFNELGTLTNYMWYADYNKVLNFKPKSGTPGTVSLGFHNCVEASVTKSRGMGPYRNRQYVRAGTAMTDSRTEPLRGDSFRRTFNTTFPVERTPTITLNGTPVSVGIHGLDSGKQYYWTRGNNQVVQDDTGTLLTSADVLAVTYIGRFPVSVQATADTEIATRKAIEGGSGVYESLHTDPNLNDLLASQNLAKALIERYGFIPDNLRVTTDEVGIRSGQLIDCDFPQFDISGSYLVHSVTGVDMGGSFMRYRVNLLNFLS